MAALKTVYRFLFHALLLAVYAVFFSVQFFFNFEVSSNAKVSWACDKGGNGSAGVRHVHSKQDPGRVTLFEKHSQNSSSKTSFRLNKRFQQENITPCEIIYVVPLIHYENSRTTGSYRNGFLLAVIPASQPLRGPPIVA